MARVQGSDLRRAILDTARKRLVEEGYQNLSMRKIANDIGYSATSIYLYFESKDNLVHTLIDEGMDKLNDALAQAKTQVTTPDDQLKALCEGYVRFGLENPEYYEIMFQLHPSRMERYPVDKYRKAKRNLEYFQDVLQKGHMKGVFSAKEPALGAHFIWTSLHGLVTLLVAKRVDANLDAQRMKSSVFDHLVAAFMTKR